MIVMNGGNFAANEEENIMAILVTGGAGYLPYKILRHPHDDLIIQNSEICAALRKMENLGSWEKMWQWRWDIVIQEMH